MEEMLKAVARYTNTSMAPERRAYLQSNMSAIIRAVMPDLNTVWSIWRTRTRRSIPQPPSTTTPHNCQGWTPRITNNGAMFDLCCEQQEVQLVWYAAPRGARRQNRFKETEIQIELDGEHLCWEVCVDPLNREWVTLCSDRNVVGAPDAKHRTSLLTQNAIYLCVSSGRPHTCGDLCQLSPISPSHAPDQLRCPLTHLVLAANVDSGVLPPPVDAPLARLRKRSSKPSVYDQKLRAFDGVMEAAMMVQRQTCRPQLFGEPCDGWVIGPLQYQTMGMAPEVVAAVTAPTGHPERCSSATLPNEGANVYQVTRAVVFQLCGSVDTIMWRQRCMDEAARQRTRRVADAVSSEQIIFLDVLAHECRSAMSERGVATVPVVVLTQKEMREMMDTIAHVLARFAELLVQHCRDPDDTSGHTPLQLHSFVSKEWVLAMISMIQHTGGLRHGQPPTCVLLLPPVWAQGAFTRLGHALMGAPSNAMEKLFHDVRKTVCTRLKCRLQKILRQALIEGYILPGTVKRRMVNPELLIPEQPPQSISS